MNAAGTPVQGCLGLCRARFSAVRAPSVAEGAAGLSPTGPRLARGRRRGLRGSATEAAREWWGARAEYLMEQDHFDGDGAGLGTADRRRGTGNEDRT